MLLIVLSLAPSSDSWPQDNKANVPKTFNSVFTKLRQGNFEGTVNGVLVLRTEKGKQIILDFQGSKADLKIVPDQYETYDISYKNYSGVTTSGRTKMLYSTYSMGNKIAVLLNNVEFEKTNLDGCSCETIDGISYNYIAENVYEYLILQIKKPVSLSNWQFLIRHDPDPEHNIEEIKKKEQKVIVQPDSVIVFAIKR